MADWKLDAKGDIAVAPVAGWQIATFAGMGIVVRLDLFRSEEAMLTGSIESE